MITLSKSFIASLLFPVSFFINARLKRAIELSGSICMAVSKSIID